MPPPPSRGLRLTFVGAIASALLAFAFWPTTPPPLHRVRWEDHRAEATDRLRVLWVGHSLVTHRDVHVSDAVDLPTELGRLASEAGLDYSPLQHVLFGAPLSLLWRGEPHAYSRSEPQLVDAREAVLSRADVDALVVTEGLPIRRSLELEHGAFYAQQFACAVLRRNPEARVYVYETWSHLHASDPEGEYPPASVFDWRARIEEDRQHWERLADLAATGALVEPGLLARFRRLGGDAPRCSPRTPFFLVPVGSVFVAIDELTRREQLPFADRSLAVGDLFANPYVSWPPSWPLTEPLSSEDEARTLASLRRRHPDAELDDVHPSALGVYVAALTHFATLYRRSPVGLPSNVNGLDDRTATRLQELVWERVRSDPRAGVR